MQIIERDKEKDNVLHETFFIKIADLTGISGRMEKKTMKNFRDLARKATTLSELMENREKIQTGELIKSFPDGITLNAVDVIKTSDKKYPVFTFLEDSSKFYCGGIVLSKIVDTWLKEYDGDLCPLDSLNHDLAECGGVKVKLKETKTRDGKNNITEVEVI